MLSLATSRRVCQRGVKGGRVQVLGAARGIRNAGAVAQFLGRGHGGGGVEATLGVCCNCVLGKRLEIFSGVGPRGHEYGTPDASGPADCASMPGTGAGWGWGDVFRGVSPVFSVGLAGGCPMIRLNYFGLPERSSTTARSAGTRYGPRLQRCFPGELLRKGLHSPSVCSKHWRRKARWPGRSTPVGLADSELHAGNPSGGSGVLHAARYVEPSERIASDQEGGL